MIKTGGEGVKLVAGWYTNGARIFSQENEQKVIKMIQMGEKKEKWVYSLTVVHGRYAWNIQYKLENPEVFLNQLYSAIFIYL